MAAFPRLGGHGWAASGRLEVRTLEGGPSYEAITYVVLSGPIVYEVRPNPAARGIPVTIGYSVTSPNFTSTGTRMIG